MSEPYKFYDDEFVPTAVGFHNVGAICWGNSLIQLLLGCSCLNQYLLENDILFTTNPFAYSYITLIRRVSESPYDASIPGMSAQVLSALIARCTAKQQQSLSFGQECVDEALTLFIDMIDDPYVTHMFTNSYVLNITCNKCNKITSDTRDQSIKINMFTNLLITTEAQFRSWLIHHISVCDFFKCDCGHPMMNVPRNEYLKMLREIVIIVFNKFQVKERRWFPPQIQFKTLQNTTLVYKLIGVIEHSGNANSGHYTAWTFRGDTWSHCNDNSITCGELGSFGNGEPTTTTKIKLEPTTNTFMVAYNLMQEIPNVS